MPESAAPSQIGPYTVERELGRGGMGVVYLAKDTRLGRTVAIKAITPEFVNDAERLARFEREAKALAAVHHTNIASIHDLAEADGRRYLVLEYVEGTTLDERLAASANAKGGTQSRLSHVSGGVPAGAMPVDEALAIAVQIASGLEAAHEAGIVHRDLKPSNVKTTPDGTVKLLDFGLAKEAEGQGGTAADMLSSPTMTRVRSNVTGHGMVIGTAGYMSPEQARGKPLDKRTDIWAFGCVLFECLSGSMVFGGETTSDAIAAILEREPDWSKLPARTPMRVRELLKHCLEKDQKRRLRDIGDARIELEHALAGREWTSTGAMAAATGNFARPGGWKRTLGTAAAWATPVLLAAVAVLGYQAWRGSHGAAGAAGGGAEAPKVNRLSLDLKIEDGERYNGGGPTRDGRSFVYGTSRLTDTTGRSNRLWVRPMDSFESRVLEGSDGAGGTSFSPDGRWIAFVRNGESMPVRKAPIGGGPAVTICEHAPTQLQDLAWIDDRTIAVCGGGMTKSMWLLSADGGDLRPLKLIGLPDDVVGLNSLTALNPGERTVLISAGVESGEKGYHESLFAVDADTGQVRELVEKGAGGQLVGGDVMLFARVDSLLAQRVDPVTKSPTGSITPLISGLRTSTAGSATAWRVTRDGTLVYRSGGVQGRDHTLAIIKSDGQAQRLGTVREAFVEGVTPSPDGTQLACVIARENLLFSLGVYDMASDRLTRLPTEDLDTNGVIVWARDGRSLLFPALTKGRGVAIYQMAADGSTKPKVVHECGIPNGWTVPALLADAAGEWLLAVEFDTSAMKADWMLVPLAGGPSQSLAKTMDFAPFPGSASPDGKWMACGSVDGGRSGVSIFKMPVPGETYSAQSRRRIVADGSSPLWSSDGKTLYYGSANSLMALELKPSEAEPTPAGAAKQVLSFAKTPLVGRAMLMPGTHDLIGVPDSLDNVGVVRIDVVQNWMSEVREKLTPPGAGAAK